MIQRMSDQHKISFLEKEIASDKVTKSEAAPEKTLNQLAEEQKAKKLSNKDDGFMTTQHIFSARTGKVTNEGGPSTFTKSDSANTIWDANKNAKASEKIDNKTKTIQEKEHIASNRRDAENKRVSDLAETLKSTLQGKASSVSPAGTLNGTNYKSSKNNMSIFDDKDFMRLSDKTGGEKVSEEVKARKNQVDDSWRGGGRSITSRDVTKNFMESLFKKSE